ncbi:MULTISPECIES: hypothetical protein [unclassified Streptococcus]|uniref:hypothetical protein n=1 Tax=unclassified Streptococcus TaxID=2608887 RepID=UPI00359D79AE
MSDKIISLEQHRQDLKQVSLDLSEYKNDGTLNSMMTESVIQLTDLVRGLSDIVTGQQTVLESLTHRVEQLEKAKTRRT